MINGNNADVVVSGGTNIPNSSVQPLELKNFTCTNYRCRPFVYVTGGGGGGLTIFVHINMLYVGGRNKRSLTKVGLEFRSTAIYLSRDNKLAINIVGVYRLPATKQDRPPYERALKGTLKAQRGKILRL